MTVADIQVIVNLEQNHLHMNLVIMHIFTKVEVGTVKVTGPSIHVVMSQVVIMVIQYLEVGFVLVTKPNTHPVITIQHQQHVAQEL
jgi:hypothetical protein